MGLRCVTDMMISPGKYIFYSMCSNTSMYLVSRFSFEKYSFVSKSRRQICCSVMFYCFFHKSVNTDYSIRTISVWSSYVSIIVRGEHVMPLSPSKKPITSPSYARLISVVGPSGLCGCWQIKMDPCVMTPM